MICSASRGGNSSLGGVGGSRCTCSSLWSSCVTIRQFPFAQKTDHRTNDEKEDTTNDTANYYASNTTSCVCVCVCVCVCGQRGVNEIVSNE